MKKINWEIRKKNPWFWIFIAGIVVNTILAYNSMEPADLTTWSGVWELLAGALSNPYLLWSCAWAVVSTLIDPTTPGLTDSKHALEKKDLK